VTAATLRRAAALSLAVLLALPMGPVAVAATSGTIRGSVLLEGRPLSGVTVAFIELESGEVVRAVSGENGVFETAALPGQYAVTTESRAGLTVGSAPVQVAVAAGQVASAEVALLAVPSALPLVASAAGAPQQPPPADTPPADLPSGSPQQPGMPVYVETTGSGASIRFEPVTCFVAGEYPLLDANIDPVQSVARARIYFRAAVSDQYYYVEMTQDAGLFYGKLPRPQVEASPITYYLQSTTAEFEESQTREIEAIVVEDESECEGRPVAAFGPPGAVTVFSAASGAAVSPAGFAALSAGIAVGTIALIVGGAAAAGVVGGVVTPGGPGTEVPPVIVEPSPIPTPTPLPTPEPTPIPTPPITAFR
jgi:hypothetical protein